MDTFLYDAAQQALGSSDAAEHVILDPPYAFHPAGLMHTVTRKDTVLFAAIVGDSTPPTQARPASHAEHVARSS